MEMNIKEAKEFLERRIELNNSIWEVRVYGELLEVIQYEEKFEKMWKELRNEDVKNIWQMEAIEKIYFPKEK